MMQERLSRPSDYCLDVSFCYTEKGPRRRYPFPVEATMMGLHYYCYYYCYSRKTRIYLSLPQLDTREAEVYCCRLASSWSIYDTVRCCCFFGMMRIASFVVFSKMARTIREPYFERFGTFFASTLTVSPWCAHVRSTNLACDYVDSLRG